MPLPFPPCHSGTDRGIYAPTVRHGTEARECHSFYGFTCALFCLITYLVIYHNARYGPRSGMGYEGFNYNMFKKPYVENYRLFNTTFALMKRAPLTM